MVAGQDGLGGAAVTLSERMGKAAYDASWRLSYPGEGDWASEPESIRERWIVIAGAVVDQFAKELEEGA